MSPSEVPHQQPVQVSNLPGLTTYITGHDPKTGKAIVQSKRPGTWSSYNDKLMGFNVAYTTSQFPASLNGDADLRAHDALTATKKLGLVNPGGTVCRIVDFAPGFECMMHRTQSLDYGIVLEGSIELVLDSGETQTMHRGDVAVQRATMHAWRNPSNDEWARMVFVLQDCEKVVLGDTELKEDLGRGVAGLPSSGNDK
jgi:quercetin dioxygenase-like cupin family protein